MSVSGTPQRPKPPQRRTELGCMSFIASVGLETILLISRRVWEEEKCRVRRISWIRVWGVRRALALRRHRVVWEVRRVDDSRREAMVVVVVVMVGVVARLVCRGCVVRRR